MALSGIVAIVLSIDQSFKVANAKQISIFVVCDVASGTAVDHAEAVNSILAKAGLSLEGKKSATELEIPVQAKMNFLRELLQLHDSAFDDSKIGELSNLCCAAFKEEGIIWVHERELEEMKGHLSPGHSPKSPPMTTMKNLANDGLTTRSIAIKRDSDFVKDVIQEYEKQQSVPAPILYSLQDDLLILRNNLEIGDLISSDGAFGVVYRGTWKRMDVVIKELRGIASSAEMRTFLREARVWHGARHKNIVSFFGANDREPPFFLVSEFASNGNLMDYLEKEKRNGRSVVWKMILDIAVGLEVLYSKGIIHGDLKGNNIVVSADGTAMLTDFGLSFFENGSLSMPANLNPRWRAPEYVNGTATRPSAESDVYALGMCIVEILTGEPPWAGVSSNAAIRHHLKNKIPMLKPKSMTDRDWELVKKMTCYTRSERIHLKDAIATIEQFAEAEANAERESSRAQVDSVQLDVE